MVFNKNISFKNKAAKTVAAEILSSDAKMEDLNTSIALLNKDPLGLMFLSEVEFYINKALAQQNISKRFTLEELEKKPLFSLPLYLSSYIYMATQDITAKDVSWEWEKYHIEFFEAVLGKISLSDKVAYQKQYEQLLSNLKLLPGGNYTEKKLYAAAHTPKRVLSFADLLKSYHTPAILDSMTSYEWEQKTLSENIEARKAFLIFKTLFISNHSVYSYAYSDNMWDKTIKPALEETVRIEDFLALDYILKRLSIPKETYWYNLAIALPKHVSMYLSEHSYEKTVIEQQFLNMSVPKNIESVAFKHKI